MVNIQIWLSDTPSVMILLDYMFEITQIINIMTKKLTVKQWNENSLLVEQLSLEKVGVEDTPQIGIDYNF